MGVAQSFLFLQALPHSVHPVDQEKLPTDVDENVSQQEHPNLLRRVQDVLQDLKWENENAKGANLVNLVLTEENASGVPRILFLLVEPHNVLHALWEKWLTSVDARASRQKAPSSLRPLLPTPEGVWTRRLHFQRASASVHQVQDVEAIQTL